MWYNRYKENDPKPGKTLHLEGEMNKRKPNQVSLFENPAMFQGIALDPKNEWVKLAGIIP